MSWRMAKALDVLRAEINARAPERSKHSDGGIGDAAHRSRHSDHNPCECCRVVTARDFTQSPKNGFDAAQFAKWLRERVVNGDERRVKHVIWDRRIFSGPGEGHPPGVWREYRGPNPHTSHIHVSVRHPARFYDDDTSWGWKLAAGGPEPEDVGGSGATPRQRPR